MMMALAAHARPARACSCPAASRCRPSDGEDAGKVQTIGARFAHGEITLEEAAGPRLPRLRLARRRLPVPRHRGDLAGRRRGARPVAAALRARALGPADLARHGAPLGARAGGAGGARHPRSATSSPTPPIRNAMVVHAAFGGSTNLLLHIPAIAHAAGLRRPTVEDWIDVNRRVPRLVDVLPNGPRRPPDRARLPRRRRARGDAAPARAGPARRDAA